MKSISSKNYLILLLLVFIILFGSNTLATWLVGVPRGDLVRIGKFSENQFSYLSSEYPMPTREVKRSDIAVLGDSFSRPHLWQTQARSTLKEDITTYDYHDVGCPANFFDWVKKELKPKILVIQVVERMFPQFSETRTCPDTPPKIRPYEIPENLKPKSSYQKLFQQDLFFNISAVRNSLNINHKKSFISSKVINSPLKRSDLFSNPKSNRLLYLKDDLNKFKWSQEEIDASINGLLKIKNQFKAERIQLIVVVIPDKLSIYEDDLLEGPQQESSIHERLYKENLSLLNLKKEFKKIRFEQKDLYAPNDSHLSVEGYQYLGKLIADQIKYLK
jgi:hypothetical protein